MKIHLWESVVEKTFNHRPAYPKGIYDRQAGSTDYAQIDSGNNKRMNLILKYFIILFFVCSINLFSQSTDEPVYNLEIYSFIDNQSSKGNIKIFDAIRPYNRLTIAEKLLELSDKISSLSSIEKEQLDFYKSEYAFEIKFIEGDTTQVSEFFKSGEVDRFKLYKYYDIHFTFDADPVLGLGYDFITRHPKATLKFLMQSAHTPVLQLLKNY